VVERDLAKVDVAGSNPVSRSIFIAPSHITGRQEGVGMGHEPTISVKGIGNVSLPPDMTVILFEMSSHSREYAATIEDLNERVAVLRKKLSGVKIDPKKLKTTRFNVDADYRYVKNKSIFNGWIAKHNLQLELSVDRDQLNSAFEAVTTEKIQAEFHVRFEVRDKAAVREAVLADATRMAQKNAEAIASAAGCRLGKVLKMEYGWSEIRFQSVDYCMSREPDMCEMSAPDIEPEDVEAQDSVTVVWELLD
jgi:uncharacterized protein YggE